MNDTQLTFAAPQQPQNIQKRQTPSAQSSARGGSAAQPASLQSSQHDQSGTSNLNNIYDLQPEGIAPEILKVVTQIQDDMKQQKATSQFLLDGIKELQHSSTSLPPIQVATRSAAISPPQPNYQNQPIQNSFSHSANRTEHPPFHTQYHQNSNLNTQNSTSPLSPQPPSNIAGIKSMPPTKSLSSSRLSPQLHGQAPRGIGQTQQEKQLGKHQLSEESMPIAQQYELLRVLDLMAAKIQYLSHTNEQLLAENAALKQSARFGHTGESNGTAAPQGNKPIFNSYNDPRKNPTKTAQIPSGTGATSTPNFLHYSKTVEINGNLISQLSNRSQPRNEILIDEQQQQHDDSMPNSQQSSSKKQQNSNQKVQSQQQQQQQQQLQQSQMKIHSPPISDEKSSNQKSTGKESFIASSSQSLDSEFILKSLCEIMCVDAPDQLIAAAKKYERCIRSIPKLEEFVHRVYSIFTPGMPRPSSFETMRQSQMNDILRKIELNQDQQVAHPLPAANKSVASPSNGINNILPQTPTKRQSVTKNQVKDEQERKKSVIIERSGEDSEGFYRNQESEEQGNKKNRTSARSSVANVSSTVKS